jgi:hypothetical protein
MQKSLAYGPVGDDAAALVAALDAIAGVVRA